MVQSVIDSCWIRRVIYSQPILWLCTRTILFVQFTLDKSKENIMVFVILYKYGSYLLNII